MSPSRLRGIAGAAIVTLLVVLVSASTLLAEKSEDERIAEINRENAAKGYKWTAGKTSVSSLTPEERKALRGLLPLPDGWGAHLPVITAPEAADFPTAFDWRQQGGVSSVKNQLSCGSCWAFAAVGQLESHVLIYDQREEDLSEQQSIDCNSWGASCSGGWAPASYDIFTSTGAVTEFCYPYEARDGMSCRQGPCTPVARIASYMSVLNNVDAIKQALQTGPVVTAMTALDDLDYYTGGCYQTQTTANINHAVLIIGWDDNACGGGEGAWIVKNSWGPFWGMSGFFIIKYGAANIGSYAYQITYIPSTVLVHVDSPEGGEIWNVGEQYQISWTTERQTPDSMSIFLSLNEGQSYDDTIATGLVGVTSFDWTVPELPVGTARIKVVAYYAGTIGGFDMSDENFTIKGMHPYRFVSKTGGNVSPYSIPQWAAQSIQEAVDAAEPGDTVVVAGDTYSQSVRVQTPVYLLGGWNGSFTERNSELFPTTIWSSGSLVSFINIPSGTCGIEGFTLKRGSGTYGEMPYLGTYGGGVLSYNASPIIRGNKIDSCGVAEPTTFSGGGGIACYGGAANIDGNEINGCAAQCGAGIYIYQAQAVINGNHISGGYPSAEFNGEKKGGGIYANRSIVSLQGNTIENNDGSRMGAGIYLYLSPSSLHRDTIALNDGSEAGGGICAERSALMASRIVVRENTSNSTGGGIYQRSAELQLINSIIASNRARTLGGGICVDSIWGNITNNTFDRNRSRNAGGNIFFYAMPPAGIAVANNLVTYGTKNGFQVINANNITFRFNDCFGNSPSDVATLVPDATNTSRNPHYADTTAFDYHLLVHSGGIDTGDPMGGNDLDGSRADAGAFGGPFGIMAAPAYVKNVSAVAVNDSTIQLAWDAIPGDVASYAVYGSVSSGFVPDELVYLGSTAAPGLTFDHYPVPDCRYYRVSAVNGAGYGGGYSAEAGACVPGVDLIPPEITVLFPNGGELLETGDTVSVNWEATDNRWVDSVSIFYSEDAGATYELIAHGFPADSFYAWIVPSSLSDSCLVRIVAYDPGGLSAADVSDARFKIRDYTDVHDKGDGGGGATPRYATALEQNYPNPFNGTTTVSYSVAAPCRVELGIYDPAGRAVRTLERGDRVPGRYTVLWDGADDAGRDVASGVYFCRLKAGKISQTMKIVYLR